MKISSFFLVGMILLVGCTTAKPQKGGGTTAGPASVMASSVSGPVVTVTPDVLPAPAIGPRQGEGMPVATLAQPENPSASSGQNISYERTTEVSIPVEAATKTETTFPDGRKVTVIETRPAGTVVKETVKQGVQQEVSGSWKDTAREMAAKLGSYKGVQAFGVILLVAAAAMFHPAVRTIIGGGKTTQMATAAVGVLLVFGPSLVVGNEKLLLVGGIGFLAWHYLTSRHSYIEGKLDANNNGIPDDKEKST